MEKQTRNLIWVSLIIVALVIGLIMGSLIFNKKETFCIWKITTNNNSIHPDAVVWQDAPHDSGYVESILQEGHIRSIETVCKEKK